MTYDQVIQVISLLVVVGIIYFIYTKRNHLSKIGSLETTVAKYGIQWLVYIAALTTPLEIAVLFEIAVAGGDPPLSALSRLIIPGLIEIITTFSFAYVLKPAIGKAMIDKKLSFKEFIFLSLICSFFLFVGLIATSIIFYIYLSVVKDVTIGNPGQLIGDVISFAVLSSKQYNEPVEIYTSIYATPAMNVLIILIYIAKYFKVVVLEANPHVIFKEEIELYLEDKADDLEIESKVKSFLDNKNRVKDDAAKAEVINDDEQDETPEEDESNEEGDPLDSFLPPK